MADNYNHANRLRGHATGAGPVRLLVVDCRPAVRRGLKMRLGLEEDLEVVGEAGDAAEAISQARDLRPDVILMDVEMRGGIAITEALRPVVPRSAVVALTLRDDAATREQARAAGATALVAKHRTERILLAAIRGVALTKANRRRPEMGGYSKRPARTERRYRPCHYRDGDRHAGITRPRSQR